MARRSTSGHAGEGATTTHDGHTVDGGNGTPEVPAPPARQRPEGATEARPDHGDGVRPPPALDRAVSERPERREVVIRPGKTSTAAAFALAFGVSALITSITVVLAPVGVLLGIIALLLGAVGRRKAALPHLTGKGVAVGGIVTGVLGLLIGITVIAGAAALWSDEGAVAELEQRLQDAGIEIQR